MAPGAISKVASKSLNSAKELASICKNIQLAQETLILETASGIGIPAKVSEIVEMAKNTANLGEELGLGRLILLMLPSGTRSSRWQKRC